MTHLGFRIGAKRLPGHRHPSYQPGALPGLATNQQPTSHCINSFLHAYQSDAWGRSRIALRFLATPQLKSFPIIGHGQAQGFGIQTQFHINLASSCMLGHIIERLLQ
jgi:hypothetical protein